MTGQLHDMGGARGDTRQLLAQQHEDNAVGRELNDLPHGIAADARFSQRLSALLGIAHGDAGGDRGQDARTVQPLSQQIGGERNEQTDQHL